MWAIPHLISYMISYMTQLLWYHIWYWATCHNVCSIDIWERRLDYVIMYTIITYLKYYSWYHIWYQTQKLMSFFILGNIMMKPMIIYIYILYIYNMLCMILFQQIWYHIWYSACLMSYLICLCMISYIMCLIDSDIIYNAGRLASSQACPSTSRTTEAVLCTVDDVHQQARLEYLFSRVHPILSWLPGLNWQRGWVKTLGRSCVLPPSKALNGLWGGDWMPS